MVVQELNESHIGSTVRIVGRRPMKVLGVTQFPNNALKRVVLHVIIDNMERTVEIRQDTEVLGVDINA